MKTLLTAGITLVLAFACPPSQAQSQPHTAHAPAPSAAAIAAPKLQAALRGLWRGHVAHTREYAFAVQGNHPKAARAAEAAVVANARSIADAVAGFYGKPAGERMMTLLAGHWGAVKAMTDAEQRGDTKAHANALQALTTNAGEIAAFLSGANPYLPKDAVFGLLAAHGAHHAQQVAQIMRRDAKGERTTWAAMQTHMDTIADALAQALARQFPGKAA